MATVVVPRIAGAVAYDPTAIGITGGTAKFDDGALATPAFGFAAAATGFYRDSGTGRMVAVVGGSESMGFTANFAIMPAAGAYSWTATGDLGTIDTQLTRGAAGIIKFASANSFSANAAVATSITSVGPTGANTTVQEWLTIKNASGTTRYIPCF